jgi:hypothetical protein
MRKMVVLLLGAVLLIAAVATAQDKVKKKAEATRSVEGNVTAPDGQTVPGAVVFLKNLKSLQVVSYITKEGGTYIFHGLNPNVDYELRAESKGLSSSNRNLTSFDTRPKAVVNLKLNAK